MNIYVAGKNLDHAAEVMSRLRDSGHTISNDWVALIDNRSDMAKKAFDEREAIKDSDA